MLILILALCLSSDCEYAEQIVNRLHDTSKIDTTQQQVAEAFLEQYRQFQSLQMATQDLCKESIQANLEVIKGNIRSLLQQRSALTPLLDVAIQNGVLGELAALEYQREANLGLIDVLSRVKEKKLTPNLIEHDNTIYANSTKLLSHAIDKAHYYLGIGELDKGLKLLITAVDIPYFKHQSTLSESLAMQRHFALEEICKVFATPSFRHNENPLVWFDAYFRNALNNGLLSKSMLYVWTSFKTISEQKATWVSDHIQTTIERVDSELFPGFLHLEFQKDIVVDNYYQSILDPNRRHKLSIDEEALKKAEFCHDMELILKNLRAYAQKKSDN